MKPTLGTYPADRAAALSGVPLSTVHYWARHDILMPSVSAERTKLWSFTDLLALRTIYWLRQPKQVGDRDIPRSTMRAVRKALTALRKHELVTRQAERPWDYMGKLASKEEKSTEEVYKSAKLSEADLAKNPLT
jgi:DNA-binding transcriptional MerR regulator